jgi:hypothetical protein
MTRYIVLALALGSLAGCNSHDAKAQPIAKPVAAEATPGTNSTCVQVFTKARECTSDYIPALVDARARHDVPPGITDAVKKDRAAVVAEAMNEWETDSTDASIAATCDKIGAEVETEAASAKACLASADCAAFTTCVMPMFEKRFAK